MMINTRYSRPLGDYIVEFIGLRSWTGDQTGLHLSVIYYDILFIVSMQFVRKLGMSQLNLNLKKIFVYLIGLNILFSFVTGTIVKNVEANSKGLLAIDNLVGIGLAQLYNLDKHDNFFSLKGHEQ